ncbi:MAG: DCC1-like thiol-disulfide oxidoreductase family protein [Ginsengibacter sp.]
MDDHPVILFDGVCNFCNSTINFVIKKDKKAVLRFATLQSDIADKLLAGNHTEKMDLSSFVFIEKDKIYTRSKAALRVCRYMKGLWPLMYGFIIVPPFIRDGIYNWVARNRYQWFGKKEVCMVPAPEIRSRFLNETK